MNNEAGTIGGFGCLEESVRKPGRGHRLLLLCHVMYNLTSSIMKMTRVNAAQQQKQKQVTRYFLLISTPDFDLDSLLTSPHLLLFPRLFPKRILVYIFPLQSLPSFLLSMHNFKKSPPR